MEFDAAIVGAGTAGSVTALNLAPFRRVVMIEREPKPAWRVGESLPGIAERLLDDMGLRADFIADGHLPRYALCGAWGGAQPLIRDALADPDGHGWQIDRVKFERRLREEAVRRGATLRMPAKVLAAERAASGWILSCKAPSGEFKILARVLIDAAGRGSHHVARRNVRRCIHDRLCSIWLRAQDVALPAGIVHIEAEAAGWWYAASLPRSGGILAFHTDTDLPEARSARSARALLARARRLPMLGPLAQGPQWEVGECGYCAAHGAWLTTAAGDEWLAVGDAALSVDPLAAQGIFNALYFGLGAAAAVHSHLAGDACALPDYSAEVAAIRDTYIAQRFAWYGLERRWDHEPFWARRLFHARSPLTGQFGSSKEPLTDERASDFRAIGAGVQFSSPALMPR